MLILPVQRATTFWYANRSLMIQLLRAVKAATVKKKVFGNAGIAFKGSGFYKRQSL